MAVHCVLLLTAAVSSPPIGWPVCKLASDWSRLGVHSSHGDALCREAVGGRTVTALSLAIQSLDIRL